MQHHPGYLIGADAPVSDTGDRTSDLVCVKAAPASTQYRPGQRVRRDLGTCIRLNVLVLGLSESMFPPWFFGRRVINAVWPVAHELGGLEAGASLYLPARGLGSRAVLLAPSPRSGLSQLLLQLAFLLLQRAIRSSRASRCGLPRGLASPANAPASRARRHSTIWLEYRPSRRSSAPFSPSGAAS